MKDDKKVRVRKWRKIGSQLFADCKIFRVMKETFKHPDGRIGEFYINESNDWVQCAALVRDSSGLKTVLVKQYRFGTQKTSWEFPGGVIENGESPVAGARRELLEETGYAGKPVKLVAKYSPNPAIQRNYSAFVVIDNCRKIADPSWDSNEEIETKLVSVSELDKMIEKGEIYHAIAINSVYFLKRYIEKL